MYADDGETERARVHAPRRETESELQRRLGESGYQYILGSSQSIIQCVCFTRGHDGKSRDCEDAHLSFQQLCPLVRLVRPRGP